MKNPKPLVFSLAALLAGYVLPTSFLNAAPGSGERATSTSRPVTAMYANGLRARDIMRMSVRSSAGETLGKVSDLAIDTRSGQVVYVIVSSGGIAGLGDTSRAVPIAALRFENDRRESFTLDLPAAEFQRAPAFSAEQLAALSDENRSEYVHRAYRQKWQPLTASGENNASSAFPLRLASSLMDADLRTGDQTIAHSNDLVVNVEKQKAALLVQPNERFAGTASPIVVPFNYVSVGEVGNETFAARLTRDDFNSAQTFDDNAWNTSSGIYRWEVGGR